MTNFGMVGLGKMGANIVLRLAKSGIQSVVYDANPSAITALESQGAFGAKDLKEFASKLKAPRHVWIMVPASVTNETIEKVAAVLESGDTIIDGGNSYFRNDLVNAQKLKEKEINFVDVGTSGGVYGLKRGYSLMIGGESSVVKSLDPIFKALAPGIESAERTPGKSGEISTAEQGYLHCGPVGSGHYVKMIHNGIEYGMMAAMAEGLGILDEVKNGDPAYNLNLSDVTEVWRRGSVVASWLLDLTAEALLENNTLESFSTEVSDSGEGRWTVDEAVRLGVPASVLSNSLFSRFASRGNDNFANRALSAMRYKFGGHNERPKK